MVANLNAAYGLHLNDTALERMRANLYAVYRRELKPMAGLIDALDEIAIPACVASSSQMERVRISLTLTGLIERFDPAIYSAAMVPQGKPAPDLFLFAADAMLTSPERCLVIEDSPAGIVAAQRAGMRVFAFLGGGHIEPSGLRCRDRGAPPDDDFRRYARPAPSSRRGIDEGEGVVMGDLLVGVDVGTGSARAGVFSPRGVLLGRAEHPIAMRRPAADEAEHDSADIWQAVGIAIRGAMAASSARPEDVAAIGFDATCSLVVLDSRGAPLPVTPGGEVRWNTMVWLDHRAMVEAAECTATGHAVLGHLGGVMSPEMQIPKLMWLKRHHPATWAAAGQCFDLVDFLTWRASGSVARSRSTLACKWTWGSGLEAGWPTSFLAQIRLDDLVARADLPDLATPAGADLGPLTREAAGELGLTPGCRVAAGLIDAHAGALGVLGASARSPTSLGGHLCLIAGTSNSILALAADARPIDGVWGPYLGAILPEVWLVEAGQSATARCWTT